MKERPKNALAECPELDGDAETLASQERHIIMKRIADCGGNLTLAAQTLGIGRETIHRKLKSWGLVRKTTTVHSFEPVGGESE